MRDSQTLLALALALALLAVGATAQVRDLTEDSFNRVVGGEKPAVIAFTLTDCPHCQRLKPVFDEVAADVGGVVMGRVNSDTQERLADEYHVDKFPTILYFGPHSADAKDKLIGEQDAPFLKRWINRKKHEAVRGPVGRIPDSSFKVRDDDDTVYHSPNDPLDAEPADDAQARPAASNLHYGDFLLKNSISEGAVEEK